jgi:hypothetical protein
MTTPEGQRIAGKQPRGQSEAIIDRQDHPGGGGAGRAANPLFYATDARQRCGPGWLTVVGVAQALFGTAVLFLGAVRLMRGSPPGSSYGYWEFLMTAVSLTGALAGLCHIGTGTALLRRQRIGPHDVRRALRLAMGSLVPFFLAGATITLSAVYDARSGDMFAGPAIVFFSAVSVVSAFFAIIALAAARALRAASPRADLEFV